MFFRQLLPVRFLLSFVFISTIICTTAAQDNYSTPVTIVEDLIEQIARMSDEQLDYQTLFRDIYKYVENPLNLNTASTEELEDLHILSDFQILSLQDYIRENGPLLSIYELPLVHGFSESIARTLEPIVFTGPAERALPSSRKHSHDLLMFSSAVFEEQKGFSETDPADSSTANTRYPGNRLRLMTKYRYSWGNKLHIGYNGDKDSGEPMFGSGNPAGYDFNSLYIRLNDVWKFKTILAGDYQAKTAQGLMLWSGLAFGKSPDIINVRRKGPVLNEYTSVDENRFLRGVAASMELGNLEITALLSHKKIDANIIEDTLTGKQTFSSFQTSGYHRTSGEISDKDAVTENLAGGILRWNGERLRLGTSILHYRYDLPYDASRELRSNTNMGLDYHLSLKRVNLFGELAYSQNSARSGMNDRLGVLNGASFQLHPKIYMSVLQRYMGAGYFAAYGNAFRENSQNTNESGLYMGLELLPIPNWKLTAFLDAYRFPYLAKLFADRNSGYDYHLQADYTRTDRLGVYLRYRYKTRPENINTSGTDPDLPIPTGSQLRMHITYRVTPSITFQNRLEFSQFEQESREQGWLAYHDILYRPSSVPLAFSFRYAMFNTESYDTRIYTYEHDALYYFAMPSWSGRGIRTYLNTRLDIGRRLDLWLKYSLSWYSDRETIGSGLNEISTPHRQDIHIQLRLKF